MQPVNYRLKKNKDKNLQDVNQVLNRLHLTPLHPVKTIVTDPTREHYADVVFNDQKKAFFLKVKLFDNEVITMQFWKNRVLGQLLAKYPDLSLRRFSAPLLDSDQNYLLYTYIPGKNLSSRTLHDLQLVEPHELPMVVNILKAILDIPIDLLPASFERKGWDFFISAIFEETRWNKNISIISQHFTAQETNRIQSLKTNSNLRDLIEKNSHYFCHGDFQPCNLIRSKQQIYVTDWDLSAISLKYLDLAKFYRVSYRKPNLQQKFLEIALASIGYSDKERILLLFTLFTISFLETVLIAEIINNTVKDKWKDFAAMSEIFPKRVHDSKKFLEQLYSYL